MASSALNRIAGYGGPRIYIHEALVLFNNYYSDEKKYRPVLHRYSSSRFFNTNYVTPDKGKYIFPGGTGYINSFAINENALLVP